MADVTFTRPDLDTFAGVDGLGLVITLGPSWVSG